MNSTIWAAFLAIEMSSKGSPKSVMGWLAKSFNIGTRGRQPSQGSRQLDGRASPAPFLQFETAQISGHQWEDDSYEGTPSEASLDRDMGLDQATWVMNTRSVPEIACGTPTRLLSTIDHVPEKTVRGHDGPVQKKGKKVNGAERPSGGGGHEQRGERGDVGCAWVWEGDS